jgi:flagellar biosynthetic protein FliR
MTLDINTLLTLFLVYMRVFGFLMLIPIFGREFMPPTFKFFLVTAVSFSLLLYSDIKPLEFPTTGHFFIGAAKEFIFGFVAGLILRFIFDAMQIAGELVSVNVGLGLATVFFPQQPQTTVMALIFSLFTTLLFISFAGPEITFMALSRSFEKFPPGTFDLYIINPEFFLKFFYESFILAFKVSLPVIASMLIFNIILALVNRFIPQINVFIVGLPAQLFVGMVILIVVFPVIYLLISSHVRKYIINFVNFLGG